MTADPYSRVQPCTWHPDSNGYSGAVVADVAAPAGGYPLLVPSCTWEEAQRLCPQVSRGENPLPLVVSAAVR